MSNDRYYKSLLIVFGGLPGTGKTSLAKALAARIQGLYLRIDTIEQALRRENCLKIGHEGYLIAYAIAEENLRLGNAIIADSVNSIAVTRDAWHNVAQKTSAQIVEIEVICSDSLEHKRRVEERQADIEGHQMPTWEKVTSHVYQIWDTKNFVIDTARQTIPEAIENILRELNQRCDKHL